MSDYKPQCHRRKRHFKWSLILSRTPRASRLSLSLQMSQKSLCSSSGILLRRIILDICPRVEGVNFTYVPDDDTTLAFLIKLSYKGPLYKYTNMFIPPKKNRGKGSQRKKTVDDSQETVDVSEEFEPEPELVKRKTSSKRRVKKKVTLSADDNIISDDPDTALELGKSISKTEAEEAEAARQVHTTHARIVTESVLKPTKRRKSDKVTSDPPKKLKGTGGSSEGTGTIPGVPDKSTFIFDTSSEGTGTKPGVPDEEKNITKENVILEWGSEQESEYSEEDKLDDEEKDDKEGEADDEDDETGSDEDDIYKFKICVRKDEDEEMFNTKVEDSDKGDEEIIDAAKVDAEKTSEVKDDAKDTIDQFLKLTKLTGST
ncbi:hypothetical protein Tco_1114926 [Tanacetum coccineum]